MNGGRGARLICVLGLSTMREEPPKVFKYEELVAATDSWGESRILGTGGFGTVYSGRLGGGDVAIKRILLNSQPDKKKAKIKSYNRELAAAEALPKCAYLIKIIGMVRCCVAPTVLRARPVQPFSSE